MTTTKESQFAHFQSCLVKTRLLFLQPQPLVQLIKTNYRHGNHPRWVGIIQPRLFPDSSINTWIITIINQPRTGLAVDSYLLPTSKSRDTKTRTIIKNPASISFSNCALIIKIRGHLPAPIINGDGDSLWKWRNFWLSVLFTLTLNRGILHTVMHRSSTSTYTPNFMEIEETFCGQTDVRTGGHLRPTLLGRLGGIDLINRFV